MGKTSISVLAGLVITLSGPLCLKWAVRRPIRRNLYQTRNRRRQEPLRPDSLRRVRAGVRRGRTLEKLIGFDESTQGPGRRHPDNGRAKAPRYH